MSNNYDQICARCAGTGLIDTDDEESACEHCAGYGYLLTDAGFALIEFLKRRGVSVPMSPQAENELSSMLEKG